MNEHYAAVLADLEAQRDRIGVAIAAIRGLQPAAPAPTPMRWTALEEAPPKPKRIIPTDPDELKAAALRLLDAGYGMNEVKTELELTEEQARAFFFG